MSNKHRTQSASSADNNAQNVLEMLYDSQMTAKIGTWWIDVPENKINWTPQVYRIFGLDPNQSEPTFEEFFNFVHPDDLEFVRQKVNEQLTPFKNTIKYVYRIKLPDGNSKTLQHIGRQIRNDSKKITRIIGTIQDITDQKKVERALMESEEQYRFLFENTVIGVGISNLEGKVLKMNKAMSKITGYSLKDIIKINLEDIYVNSEDRKKLLAAIKKHGFVENFEVQLKNKQGLSFWASLSCKPIMYNEEKVFLTTAQNINKRKQAEQELRLSQQSYETIFNSSTDSIFIHDYKTGEILDANQAVLDNFGYTKEEICKMTVGDLSINVPPYTQKEALEWIKKAAEEGPQHFEWLAKKRNGELLWHHNSLQKVTINGRESLLVIGRNITDRKKAEEELQESKNRFDLAMKATRDGLFDWNLVTNEIYYSPGWKRMLGYQYDELPNDFSVWKKLTDPEDVKKSWKVQNELINKKRDRFEIEFKMKHKDGHWVDILSRAEVIFDESGKAVRMVGTHVDITEKKRAEAELQKIQKLNSVGTLAGGIAHDFNNILVGIFGNVSLAKSELPQTHPVYKLLGDAELSLDRATRLTGQLLTFAKGGEPVRENVSLGKLVEEIVRFDLSGSRIMPIFKVPENLWPASVDKGQIQQVIANLTINAKQAMPNGGHLYVNLENTDIQNNKIPGLKKGKYIKIIIRDEGTGIDRKYLDRIYDPYFSTKQTGSGLGLATVYSIINKHDGYINVDSELGQGTSFTLYLPVSETRLSQKVKPAAEKTFGEKQNFRILLMDDDEMICTLVTKMLQKHAVAANVAHDGKQTIEMYKQELDNGNPYNAVIMDLTIPGGMGGKEAIKKILEIDRQAKVIVSSGYADDPVMAKFSDYGFKNVLTKPYTENELLDVLSRVLKS